jgi:hypothetical protein
MEAVVRERPMSPGVRPPARSSSLHLAAGASRHAQRDPDATALLATAALAFALSLGACERTSAAGDSPVKAVKDFLNDGVVDHNGHEACVYMTTRQQRAGARLGGLDECREVFDLATLELGGETVDTVHKVEALAAQSTVDGDRAWVRLSRGGENIEFRLVKAGSHEKQQFLAPDTEWRIARGGLSVIPGARS